MKMSMMDGGLSVRKPVFDVKVSAQKASMYSRIANNELAKELYGMGVFAPQNADQALAVIKMMDFDKRDEVIKQIQENGTMFQQIQRMQETMAQMAGLIYEMTGNQKILSVLDGTGIAATNPQMDTQEGEMVETNSIGEPIGGDNSTAGKARQRAATATEVGGR